jgi:integrase
MLDLRHLTSWVRAMQDKQLSPKTIRNVHGLISSAMETAIRLGYRPDNPCRGVTLPTTEHAEDKEQFLTWDEWQLIYKHLSPTYQPLGLFLVMTGARFGEATAVNVADVNWRNVPATVRISKSWKRDGANAYYVGAPKTASSKRTVAVPPAVIHAVKPLMTGVTGDTLLFRTSTGGRMAQKYFWTAWTNALAAARKEDPLFNKTPRIHDLRHTSASWGLQGGLTLYEVARRLGHSSTATTEKVYAHLMHEGMARGADVMGKMLEG